MLHSFSLLTALAVSAVSTVLAEQANPFMVQPANPFMVQQSPLPVPKEVPPAVKALSYDRGRAQAVSTGGFMVTFVGVDPVAVPGAVVVRTAKLDGFQTGDVVIGGPWPGKDLVVYETLPDATPQQIRQALAEAKQVWATELARANRNKAPFPNSNVDDDLEAAGPWPESLKFPDGMTRYKRAAFTQRIAVTNDRDTIDSVHRSQLESKWHQSGGMDGVAGFRSDLYRSDTKPKVWVGNISVLNSLGYYQQNRGWKREYPDGAKFMDVLSNDGKVFEVRQREKLNGKWGSSVLFEDETARPKGYVGLTASCNSCHSQAGSGGYATGLVPGGDGVLSDPFAALER